MNPDSDHDLREHFARQRRGDHGHAPAWNPRWLDAPVQRVRPGLPRWIPLTAAACLLLGFVMTRLEPRTPVDLTTALPEFFATRGGPLFPGIGAQAGMPSDFLLPTHLTIQLP